MYSISRLLSALSLIIFPALAYSGAKSFDESLMMPKGAKYFVKLQQEAPPKHKSKSSVDYGFWGAAGAQPSFCISSLVITRHNRNVLLQSKLFTDLCNVNSVKLSERKGKFILSLVGGDAGDSFKAEFVFNGVFLAERIVRHGEFPEVYERTQFRYNNSEN
jgi:hypothetical protein